MEDKEIVQKAVEGVLGQHKLELAEIPEEDLPNEENLNPKPWELNGFIKPPIRYRIFYLVKRIYNKITGKSLARKIKKPKIDYSYLNTPDFRYYFSPPFKKVPNAEISNIPAEKQSS